MLVNAVHPCHVTGVCPFAGLMNDDHFIRLTEEAFMDVMEEVGIPLDAFCDVFNLVCPAHWFTGPQFEEGEPDEGDFHAMFVELDPEFEAFSAEDQDEEEV